MKAVIIGGSGHFEYALESNCSSIITAFSPGSLAEDLSRLRTKAAHLIEYRNYIEMLDNEQPDVAIVNPIFGQNAAIIQVCLAKGIHCFAEKPLALKINDLEKIKSLEQTTKAKLSSMLIHRYEPWFYAAYQAFAAGAIGNLVSLNAQKSYKMGIKPAWMQNKDTFGGIIPWVGSHAIDWCTWFMKEQMQLLWSHYAVFGNNGQGEVESNASLGFKIDNALATIVLDYKRPNASATHGDDRLRIVGERGIIEVAHSKAFIETDKEAKTELEQEQEQKPNIFDDFIQYLTQGKEMRFSNKKATDLCHWSILAERMAQIKYEKL